MTWIGYGTDNGTEHYWDAWLEEWETVGAGSVYPPTCSGACWEGVEADPTYGCDADYNIDGYSMIDWREDDWDWCLIYDPATGFFCGAPVGVEYSDWLSVWDTTCTIYADSVYTCPDPATEEMHYDGLCYCAEGYTWSWERMGCEDYWNWSMERPPIRIQGFNQSSKAGAVAMSQVRTLLIDLASKGVSLTAPSLGAKYDYFGIGKPIAMSWPALASDLAFLVMLPPGAAPSEARLFTSIENSDPATGTSGLALSDYDSLHLGGNNDRVIDRQDSIYSQLRLWRDDNHNGQIEDAELHSLDEMGVSAIELWSAPTVIADALGNKFLGQARVRSTSGMDDTWMWSAALNARIWRASTFTKQR
jgi:hypothetical protein